jgi:hypothetical protein
MKKRDGDIAFLTMNFVKNRLRNRMNDGLLDD